MKTGQIKHHAGQSSSCKPTIEMLTTCDRMGVPSHPPRLGLDARHMICNTDNDIPAAACGHTYLILRTTVGVAALAHAFGVKPTALIRKRGDA